ncbi:glycine-rich protein 23-like [Penaeus japonicus]|uniref:glycine-rich protein 23-like n=1 Tax=Penaeus japonicus TaxID=27405 RepID=UPI001C70D64B|nr:glycine-rich protein 23-like [Penaeus japonicus]
MNPLNIVLGGAFVLVLVCVVSAAPQGYGAGGDSGLGVDLGGSGAGGHGGSGVGGGSVLPGVLVGSGVLPESAIGGAAGGAFGGAAGGVVGGEYSAPDAGVAGGFDAGVAGGFGDVALGEEYAAPAEVPEVAHVSPPVSEYAAPH